MATLVTDWVTTVFWIGIGIGTPYIPVFYIFFIKGMISPIALSYILICHGIIFKDFSGIILYVGWVGLPSEYITLLLAGEVMLNTQN